MKKYLFIIAAAATCMLVACSKEKELRAPEENTVEEFVHLPGWTYISATGGETETAATINGNSGAFKWSTDDKIAIFANGTYQKSAGLSSSFNNQASAEFAFEGVNAYRSDFAVFPADLVFNGDNVRANSVTNHTATSLTITLPASYKLADVQDDNAVTPMIAANEPDGTLAFKSICALLRITVKNIPKDAYTLKVSFPGKKVQGEFTISGFAVGTDGVQAVASSSEAEETITITDLGISAFSASGLVVNIPVPIGKISDSDYPYVRVGAYDATDHQINHIDAVIKGDITAPVVWNPNRLTSRKVTANLPYFVTNEMTSKKVVFAPGNLKGTIVTRPTGDSSPMGSANNFRFADHQYDALGECSGNKLSAVGDIDLFAWIGTSATYDYASNPDQRWGIIWPHNSQDYALHVGNVGTDKIKFSWALLFNGVTYPENTWRLPNNDKEGDEQSTEWQRLVSARNCTYVAAKATIVSDASNAADTLFRGVIVFPNTYVHPFASHPIVNAGKGAQTGKTIHYKDNVFTKDEWDILENVGGCAFLPVTNGRARSGGSKTPYYGDAAYWGEIASGTTGAIGMISSDVYVCTSSANQEKSGSTYVGITGLAPNKTLIRKSGCAVRLIRDVN